MKKELKCKDPNSTCSQSDWYEGGKCDLAGCWKPKTDEIPIDFVEKQCWDEIIAIHEKVKQKRLISEIMKADEKDCIYCEPNCKHCESERDIENEPVYTEQEVEVVIGKVVDHLREVRMMDVYKGIDTHDGAWETTDMVRAFMRWFKK